MPTDHFLPRLTRTPWVIVCSLLCVHAALAVGAAGRTSPTVDEVNHLPAGVTYWQQGTFALYHHNPPLVKLLAALPVLASGAEVDYGGSWAEAQRGNYPPSQAAFGVEFMRANAQRYIALYFRARCVIVVLSVVGGLVVFLWTRELFGPAAGLAATALWAFSPNVLAHAGLVTTDLPAAVAILAATYGFWRWLRVPSVARAVAAGVLLGVAQLTKFSALSLYVIWPLVGMLYVWLARWSGGAHEESATTSVTDSTQRPGTARLLLHGALIVVLSVLAINAGYAFEGTGRRLGSFAFLSSALTRVRTSGQSAYPNHPTDLLRQLYQARQNRFQDTWLEQVPVPLPEHYVLGFDEQSFETDPDLEREGGPAIGYPVYLRGELRTTKDAHTGRVGWWWYYLYALAVKVPLGTWALAGGALVALALWSRYRLPVRDELFLALPPLILLASMSLLTDINIGVRYVLAVLPFVFIFASRLASARSPHSSLIAHYSSLFVALCLGWNVATAFAMYPHYLAYFNQFAGGPSQGHRHLIDSNLDWGQDLLELKRWLKAEGHEAPIGLAYFGSMDPRVAGIDFFLPPVDPRSVAPSSRLPRGFDRMNAGTYAVSVNYVTGLLYPRCYDGSGEVHRIPPNAFSYFRRFKPIARAGYSIWIFRLSETEVGKLRSGI